MRGSGFNSSREPGAPPVEGPGFLGHVDGVVIGEPPLPAMRRPDSEKAARARRPGGSRVAKLLSNLRAMTLPEQPPKETLLRRMRKEDFDKEFSTGALYGKAAQRAAQLILTGGLVRKSKGYQDYRDKLEQSFYDEPVPPTGLHKFTTLFHYTNEEIKQERGVERRRGMFAKHTATFILATAAVLSTDAVDAHLEMSWPPIKITDLPFVDGPPPIDSPQTEFDR